MNWQLFWLFVALNIVNVVVQTLKSIITIKCGKTISALVNAGAYGLYTVVTVYMLCELPLLWKAVVVALCNLVGVYFVKWLEEKARKDKLWLVKMTIKPHYLNQVKAELKTQTISFAYYNLEKYIIFDTFCETQNKTSIVANICKKYQGKIFATENKLNL